jgi:hypothetical protein
MIGHGTFSSVVVRGGVDSILEQRRREDEQKNTDQCHRATKTLIASHVYVAII